MARSLGPGIQNQAQAEAVYRELERKRLDGKLGLLDPGKLTIGQFRRQFVAERKGHIADTSLKRYETSLKALAESFGDKILVRSLTSRKISKWAGQRLAQGVTPAGVNADLRHIKAALRRAAKWGLIEKAPDIEMVKVSKYLPRHITPEDLDTIFKAEKNQEHRRIWIFLLWTGCRRSEMLRLNWQDIRWGDKPAALVTGKGDRQRIVPLLPPVVEVLGPPHDIGPVFPPVHPDTITKWWQRLIRSCGMKGIRLHDLRHTCFTYLVSKGVPLKMVQKIAGHADIRVTMGYAEGLIGDIYDEMLKVLE